MKQSDTSKGSKLHELITFILGKVIPKASPDFDHLLHNVFSWKIEYNVEKRYTNREIGFNENGKMIIAMPLGKNYGHWTDLQMQLDDYKRFNPTQIDKQEFDNDWKDFKYKLNVS